MSTRLTLGVTAALAGLAALSRRGSRSERPEDDGDVMVVFLASHHFTPRSREAVRRTHLRPRKGVDGYLVEQPLDAQNSAPIALLLRANAVYEMHEDDDEPVPNGDLILYAYGSGEPLPMDPSEWRGSAKDGVDYFELDFGNITEIVRDLGGPLVAFDVDIIDFVNLNYPEPEDFEVAARFPRLLTYRSRGLGGRTRWNFGPGYDPLTTERTTVPMPAHLVPTIERIWERTG